MGKHRIAQPRSSRCKCSSPLWEDLCRRRLPLLWVWDACFAVRGALWSGDESMDRSRSIECGQNRSSLLHRRRFNLCCWGLEFSANSHFHRKIRRTNKSLDSCKTIRFHFEMNFVKTNNYQFFFFVNRFLFNLLFRALVSKFLPQIIGLTLLVVS